MNKGAASGNGARKLVSLLVPLLSVPLIFLLCWPFVEIGANDDWQYIRMAKVLAETGRLHYDGWTFSMVGPHALWGALFVKLFGFSFSILRASMIPVVAGCCLLIFAIGRWLGLSMWACMFGSMAFLLSPVVPSVATGFMTDPTAALLLLCTTFCVLRALTADADAAILWLGSGMLFGVAAGTVRQVMWGAPLLMGAAFVFSRRAEKRLAIRGMLALACSGIAIWLSLRWLHAQPFTYHESLPVPHGIADVRYMFDQMLKIGLTFAFFCIPALSYWLGRRSFWRGGTVWALSALFLTGIVFVRFPLLLKFPWLGNIVTQFGMLPPNTVIIGDKPAVLPDWSLPLIAIIVAASSLLVLSLALKSRGILMRDGRGDRLYLFLLTTVPFSAAYLLIVLARSVTDPVFDRYLIPLLPFAFLALLAYAARFAHGGTTIPAWLCVVIMGTYGIAIAHDQYRLLAARSVAAEQLVSTGIARECITGGYEYDAWTELNDAGMFIYPDKVPPRNTPVEYFFLRSTPHVQPRYYLVTSTQKALASPPALEVTYTSWLAPYVQKVLVQVDPAAVCPTRSTRADLGVPTKSIVLR